MMTWFIMFPAGTARAGTTWTTCLPNCAPACPDRSAGPDSASTSTPFGGQGHRPGGIASSAVLVIDELRRDRMLARDCGVLWRRLRPIHPPASRLCQARSLGPTLGLETPRHRRADQRALARPG